MGIFLKSLISFIVAPFKALFIPSTLAFDGFQDHIYLLYDTYTESY